MKKQKYFGLNSAFLVGSLMISNLMHSADLTCRLARVDYYLSSKNIIIDDIVNIDNNVFKTLVALNLRLFQIEKSFKKGELFLGITQQEYNDAVRAKDDLELKNPHETMLANLFIFLQNERHE